MVLTILRSREVTERYKIPRSTQNYWERQGLIPKQIKFGQNFSGRFEGDMERVMRARAAGATDTEVRTLVEKIEAEHKNSCADLAESA